jgi:hypothetical protein
MFEYAVYVRTEEGYIERMITLFPTCLTICKEPMVLYRPMCTKKNSSVFLNQ